ncbi:hypothetical protein DYB32_007972 [Aphanomyces invadans]|uniref:RING-type domain-containing protein n=1 Tax=Aphanomyces invadans TaxID=157072 RepID=A0A3R6Z991_9STRA|nr:hypothetical protein DYB32_007972 [Aphanomyces invadans]
MEGYVASKITDGLVYPTCFFTSPPSDDGSDSAIPTTCHAAIHPTDLRAVISSDEVWSKYEKFKFNKEHANARECPFCHHVQVSATAAVDPAITCDECHEVYCFSHSSAHPGTSCVEYEKSRRAEEKLNQAKISQIAKLCPGCGCNQMKCITCGIHFCWLCGKQVDDGVFPEHFQWWNLAGCAGAQMSESTAGQPSMLNKISWFLFRLVLCIVFGPPAFLMAIAFSIIGCCCIPCCMTSRETGQSTFLGCFCISGWVLMVPAALVLALPFLPFGLVAFYFWPDQVRALWQDEDQVPAIPPDDHPSTMYADDTAPPPSASPVADEDDLPGPYHHI